MGRWVRPGNMDNAPAAGDQDLHYKVEYFDEETLAALQVVVNDYLLSLETSNPYPISLVSLDFDYYETGGPTKEHHIVQLVVGYIGDLP